MAARRARRSVGVRGASRVGSANAAAAAWAEPGRDDPHAEQLRKAAAVVKRVEVDAVTTLLAQHVVKRIPQV
jgi:hypothetical protein